MIAIFFLIGLVTTETTFFQDKPIYSAPRADPRSPESSFVLKTSEYSEKRIAYIDASIGKEIGVLTFKDGDYKLQLLGEFATWMTLGYDSGAFPLLTQDFLLAIPLAFRYKNLCIAIKFNHISAHLGDGMNRIIDKYVDDGITLKPFAYSRDFLSLHGYYNIEDWILIYQYAGFAHKIYPKDLGRWFVGNGLELQFRQDKELSPYYSQNVVYNQDTDIISYSGQCGAILNQLSKDLFEVRLAITGYVGDDRRGQLMERNMKEFGFGLFIR